MRISDWSSDVCSADLPVDVQNLVPAVAVRPAPAPEDSQHLRREGFVEFDEVDVAPAEAAAREQPFDRGHRTDSHSARVAAGGGGSVIPGARLAPEFVALALRHAQAPPCGDIPLA